jgi:hypothetical protein
MKFTRLLTVALVVTILSLNAQAQTAGPLLWTSFIEVLGNYVRSNSEDTVVSRLTPGVAITVTRVQLDAAFGSNINLKTKCNSLPKIRVTDGTTRYGLAIPNARLIGPYPFSVNADSGPIFVSFPANAKLLIRVVPGETGCNPGSINVTVQYSIN